MHVILFHFSADVLPDLHFWHRPTNSSHSCCRGRTASLDMAVSKSMLSGISTIITARLQWRYISILSIPTDRMPWVISGHISSWILRYSEMISGESTSSRIWTNLCIHFTIIWIWTDNTAVFCKINKKSCNARAADIKLAIKCAISGNSFYLRIFYGIFTFHSEFYIDSEFTLALNL